jgi:Zn-dependent peptidase ImmA (M78 family)
VFINGADSKAAQNFTLAHELAHLWIGKSGVSNVLSEGKYGENYGQVESFCNRVAAEFLVPQREFLALWDEDDSIWINVRRVVLKFKVSSLIALIRALDAEVIQYPAFKAAFSREWKRVGNKDSEDDPEGGQFWNTFPWRVSKAFSHALAESVQKDRTTYSEAAGLLRISVPKLESFLEMEIGT